MASTTTMRSPSLTVAPSATATLTTVPCIGATSEVPVAAAFVLRAPLRRAPVAAEVAPLPSPAGRVTSKRRPSTSTEIVSRVPASPLSAEPYAGISFLNSVSIQRVCTRNGSSQKSGSRTTARWKVSAVGIPSTMKSSSARRERSRASLRVAPVTISLARSESKLPPTTSPAPKPESRRTPGPLGATNLVIFPGAGRKPRPGSSPLMRNSMLCPRSTGSMMVSFSPSAIRNCSRTKSMPVTSSETGCSTCRRVFTSRKEIVPSWPTRNSQVPAPT
ncbi:unannotated protein [freshwater metagenome]|uniref:Unannotated protein n=1 Tax=freshwater metagenome TaxID=449393 RepID=A0A6J6Q715_9ZZZZ